MSEFTRWMALNESLGFPLGVKSATNLGISNGLPSLDEAKAKKKKMDDEIDIDGDVGGEDEEPDSDDVIVKSKPEDDDVDGDKGSCSCDNPVARNPEAPQMMCKKCSKKMSKKMKKKMKKESTDLFADYYGFTPVPMHKVGTKEYEADFQKSMVNHFGNPKQTFDSGVNLDEEVLFEPKDDTYPTPQAGQVGSSPYTRIGEFNSEKPPKSEWEEKFVQVQEHLAKIVNMINESKK